MATTATTQELSAEQKEMIIRHVRELAQSKLEGRALPNRDEESKKKNLWGKCGGVFVTFHNDHHRRERLRGCIGIFVPDDPLWKVIESRALASLCDSRFSTDPITADEFRDEVDITVSILSTPKPVGDPLKEVLVGVHGIIASKGWNRGTYLPQVATDNGWDTRTFLTHCATRKAGIRSSDPCNDPSIKWESYTATLVKEKM